MKRNSFLEVIDVFGQSVGIRYNQRQYHKTKFGGVVTIVFSICKVLITQENPTVIQQENFVRQQDRFQLKPKEFVIAFGLQDAYYKHFIDEKIYSIKALQTTIERSVSVQGESLQYTKYTDIDISHCTFDHFQIDQSQSYFLSLPFKDLYCISLNQSAHQYPSIQGEFSALRFQSIEFQIHECLSLSCNRTAAAKELLRKPSLGIYFSDYNVNITERDNPFQSNGRNLFWTAGYDMEKDIIVSLVNSKVESDFGWVGESIQVYQKVSFSSQREISLTRTNSQMFRLTLLYEKNKEILYLRKYMKLIQAFSQVGGLFNFIIALGYIICRPFSQTELNRKLLNSLYDIEDNTEQRLLSQKSQLNNPSLKKSPFSKVFEKADTEMQQQNKFKDISIIMLESKRKSQNVRNDKSKLIQGKQIKQIGFLENLINCFRCCAWCQSPKSRLINHATMNIYNHIDIFNIVRRLIEVEKLKHLLLNENQIKLFEFLPRPQLNINTFQDSNYNNNNNNNNKSNYDEVEILSSDPHQQQQALRVLQDAYLQVKKNQKDSLFDRNIIQMLDPNLKEKLEQNLPQTEEFPKLQLEQQSQLEQQLQQQLHEQQQQQIQQLQGWPKEFESIRLQRQSVLEMDKSEQQVSYQKLSVDNYSYPIDMRNSYPFSSRNSIASPLNKMQAQQPKQSGVKLMNEIRQYIPNHANKHIQNNCVMLEIQHNTPHQSIVQKL